MGDRFDLAWTRGAEVVRRAIGVGPDTPGVYDAVRAVLRELDADGTFSAFRDRWGLDRAAAAPLPTT